LKQLLICNGFRSNLQCWPAVEALWQQTCTSAVVVPQQAWLHRAVPVRSPISEASEIARPRALLPEAWLRLVRYRRWNHCSKSQDESIHACEGGMHVLFLSKYSLLRAALPHRAHDGRSVQEHLCTHSNSAAASPLQQPASAHGLLVTPHSTTA
jgi:hypothetical protein